MKNNRLKTNLAALLLVCLLALGLLVSCDGCGKDDSSSDAGEHTSDSSDDQKNEGYGDTSWYDIPYSYKK